MDQRDEIKGRLSIIDLVSEYVELKKAGRNFKGLCPFHSEKSPSFVVSPDKEIAHCFGCHKGGDIFAFYQEVEGVDFVEALKDLGAKVGVEVKEIAKEAVLKSNNIKDKLYQIHEIATQHFMGNLHNLEEGKKVLAYLQNRGLSTEMIEKYKIGFAVDSYDDLYKVLLENGFTKSEIVESGLATSKDTSLSSIFDRFRLRLIFPVFSKDGKVIAFGGRALKAGETAKYLNSPETPIYHKSDVLYGYNFAKESIRQSETVILVEGYFDQIAMFQAGVKNVVAVSGTALTPRHLQLLKKTAKNIIFCLDADFAGVEALYRSAELSLVESFNLKVLNLGEYKDPGELLQKDPEKFETLIDKAVDFFDRVLELEYYSKSELIRGDLAEIDRLMQKVLPLIKKISSNIIQDVVVRKFATATGVKAQAFFDELEKLSNRKVVNVKTSDVTELGVKHFSTEEYFWGYVFWYPESVLNAIDNILNFDFVFKEKDVYKTFVDYYNNGRDLSEFRLIDLELNDEIKQKYAIIAVYLESVSSEEWNAEGVESELKKLFDRLIKEYKKVEQTRLESEIKQAESTKDSTQLKQLLDQYRQVLSL